MSKIPYSKHQKKKKLTKIVCYIPLLIINDRLLRYSQGHANSILQKITFIVFHQQ